MEHELDGVQLYGGEILIGPEKVLEVGDMPGQGAGLAEGLRGVLVVYLPVIVTLPLHGLQGVNDVLAGHEIQITPAQGVGQILVFGLRIHEDDGLPRLTKVGNNALEQMGFALSGVSENQDI